MEDEMNGAYSKHARNEKYIHNFSRKTWREQTISETKVRVEMQHWILS
jgi:hypothetical protein